jgi:MFS family permease
MRAKDHFSISAFWFAMNLIWGALLMIIIPSQMKAIAPQHPAEITGLLLGIGAIPALVVPLLAGPFSDRCMSRLGRRRPYMIVGTGINLVGLAVLWFAGRTLNIWLYFVGYFVTQIGNNIAGGAYNGIIPDVVPRPQRGTASGWMAAMSQAGTIVGVLVASQLMNRGQTGLSFLVVGATMALFLGITVFGTKETPRTEPPGRFDLREFLKSLWIDPRKHPNFAWVWITRFLVVMGLWTVQEYMQFYLTDMIGIAENQKELITGYVLLSSLVCATITGMLGGAISDRVGRKPVVYVANTVIALACVAFVCSHTLTYAFLVACVFGLGYGAYYSVDWALGCDVLPNKEDAGKDMAVWHIASVLPQSIALPIAGTLLGAFGQKMVETSAGPVAHYTPHGYTALFGVAAVYLILGAVLLRNVRGVR